MNWSLITNIILASAIAVLVFFCCLALYQWIKRKSFIKIDPELRWAPLPLALMALVYIVFDHFIILATRPNGSGEPSFPSTHVMIVATIFALVAIILPRYVQSKSSLIIIDLMMFFLVILEAIGRVLANMHWVSDVIGAICFAAIFAFVYYLILRRTQKSSQTPERSHHA